MFYGLDIHLQVFMCFLLQKYAEKKSVVIFLVLF